MDICVGEVQVDLCVSPLLATLLLQFREDEELTATELARRVRAEGCDECVCGGGGPGGELSMCGRARCVASLNSRTGAQPGPPPSAGPSKILVGLPLPPMWA